MPRCTRDRRVRGLARRPRARAGARAVRDRRGQTAPCPGRTRGSRGKQVPYESGIDTYGDTHGRFGLSFYLYALLFVAFDVEIVFIYVWALNFKVLLVDGLISMAIFIGVLLVGLAYAWRKGVLSWR